MKSTIYKNIISNLAEGIILAEPVLDKNQEIQDFCVVYSNNEANRLLKDFSEKEMYFSYSSKTSLKDNFVEIGKEVFSYSAISTAMRLFGTGITGDGNNLLNTKLLELLSSIDKSKIEQVSKMVQNMSSDDLSNLVGMLNKNINKNK